MHLDLLSLSASLLAGAPFLIIFAISIDYHRRRIFWRRQKKRGRNPGFCPSAFALGAALQFLAVFYRPSVDYAIEAREKVREEEDDSGGPEPGLHGLRHFLRRIRRGEPVGDLVLRL
jgi:hypothetical protein